MQNEPQPVDTQGQTSLVKVEEKADFNIDGELNLSDYVQDAAPTPKTIREVNEWTVKHRETARTKLAMRLMTMFGGTLTASIVLTGVAAFNPNADKALIKDLIPQLITSQSTLLGVAVGFYFTSKKEE
jgi:hypothetical protein